MKEYYFRIKMFDFYVMFVSLAVKLNTMTLVNLFCACSAEKIYSEYFLSKSSQNLWSEHNVLHLECNGSIFDHHTANDRSIQIDCYHFPVHMLQRTISYVDNTFFPEE